MVVTENERIPRRHLVDGGRYGGRRALRSVEQPLPIPWLNALPVGAALVGDNGQILGVNALLTDLLGLPAEEVTERPFLGTVPVRDRELMEAALRRLPIGQGMRNDQGISLLVNDNEVPVRFTATKQRAPDGRELLLVTFADDRPRQAMITKIGKAQEMTQAYLAAAKALNRIHEPEQLIMQLGEIMKLVVGYDSAVLMIIKEDGSISGHNRWGTSTESPTPLTHVNQAKTLDDIYRTQQGIVIADTSQDKRWIGRENIKSYLGIPIVVNEKVVAILNLNNKTPNFYTQEHLNDLEIFAADIAVAFERAQTRSAFKELSLTDELTGLPNLRQFRLVYARLVAEKLRENPSELFLLFIDADRFGIFDEILGQQTGDKVLQTLTQALINVSRGVDFFARVGGEEIIGLILCKTREEAIKRAEELRQAVSSLNPVYFEKGGISGKHPGVVIPPGGFYPLGVTIGVAGLSEITDHTPPEELHRQHPFWTHEEIVDYYMTTLMRLADNRKRIGKRKRNVVVAEDSKQEIGYPPISCPSPQ